MTPQEIRSKINKYKMKFGCAICGYKNHPAALSFDHIDPTTKYRNKNGKVVQVSDMIKSGRYSWNTIMEEIGKCRVLCMNCHMEHTYQNSR